MVKGVSKVKATSQSPLKHDKTYSTHVAVARATLGVDAACDGRSAVVVHVEVQIAVTSSEALFVKEERIVQEGEGIEYVKVGLRGLALFLELL